MVKKVVQQQQQQDTEKPKPTAKQIVGGSSWTGKLPTALLNEFCQKQKWSKPDCALSHRAGYSVVSATLVKKNPKNGETETVSLRATKEELAVLPSKELAVEARNVAATWCLHRIAHNLNFSMQMPPDHRQIWNKLEIVRKDHVKDGKAFLFDLDPFKSAKQHAVEVVKWEKEAAAKAEAPKQVTWKNVPQVEMSKDARQEIEHAIRSIQLTTSKAADSASRPSMINELVKLGFRKTHAEEACDHGSTLQAALEFLLLFTPEDDLPHQFLPPNHANGLTGSAHDTESLQLDYAAKRLYEAGYSLDLCREAMKEYRDENLAAQALQADLLDLEKANVMQEISEFEEEIESLHAIYSDACKRTKHFVSLRLPQHREYQIHVRRSSRYPMTLPSFYVSHTKPLPAYIRLAVIKKVGEYGKTVLGESMIFLLMEFLDDNINKIVSNPGKLLDLAGSVVGKIPATITHTQHTNHKRRRNIDWTPNNARSIKMHEERSLDAAKLKARQNLPAARKKDDIIKALKQNQCLVISGETGSGKSTQVVQYVLDAMIDDGLGDACNIICTQPRRISALGLADRVADERSNTRQVGYAIRGDSKQGPDTKISFVTTGVLLRRLTLSGDAGLDGVSHVFVDEVHERSIDSDFLLISLRDLLQRRRDLKVILMSATVEAELFCNYLNAQHLHIEGRTFPVEDFYLDDMPFINVERQKNGVNYEMIQQIVEHIDQTTTDGAILIFLPGTFEITRTLQMLGSKYNCLPLHASLPPAQQKKVFQKSKLRKVIAATNVAETSITIDDVIAVIDTGRVKQMNYDPASAMTKFEEVWCSKAACKQRRGRAGRVKAGKCYKVFSRALEAAKMQENTPPEIIRTPLEQVALSALAMDKDARKFLNQAVTVPDQRSLDSAITLLRTVGAVDEKEKLTPLGRLLAVIPADLKIAKLLVLASIFGQFERALIVSGCISSKSPFEAKQIDSDGDVFATIKAYQAWDNTRRWCEENGVSYNIMQEIRSNVSQYRDAIKETGLTSTDDEDNDELLKALIAASMSPNMARIQFPDLKYASTIGGAIAKDHDSRTIKFYTQDQRVFIHPSSALFSENAYKKAQFLSFFQGTMTTKYFIRGCTPCSLYGGILLGTIELDALGRGIILNDWIRVSAWPKIAVFVRMMQQVISNIMTRKIDFQAIGDSDLRVLEVMKRLIARHGM